MRNDRKILIRETVSDAISILLDRAKDVYATNPKLSSRYLRMVWDLSKSFKVRLKDKRKLFCTRCFTLWIPNKTVSVSEDSRGLFDIYTCKCGYTRKFPKHTRAKEK